MKKDNSVLKHTGLFSGIGEDEMKTVLTCLQATEQCYAKGEYVLRMGEHLHHLMILTEGTLLIQKDDYWGNRSIVSQIAPGELFGEAYLAPDSGAMLHDVIATEDSTVLFLDVDRILTTCTQACKHHTALIRNLCFALSEKNRKLVRKMGHMARRTTREKLISYLSEEATRQKSSMFSIPYNRQQLADFLSVDRSAMSNELCKMRNEGLLEFDKNRFHLIQAEE